jgi:hypothetical protein
MAGGQNSGINKNVGLRRLAAAAQAQAEEAQTARDVPRTLAPQPWQTILRDVAGDSTRWALALAHAHQATGVEPRRLHTLAPEEMEAFAAEVRAWLLDHPATRVVRPWD